KESAIVVLAVMAIYDISYRPRQWRSYAAGYVWACVPLAAFFYFRHRFLSSIMERPPDFGDNPLWGADFWTSRLTALKVLGKYLYLLAWPLNLSPDYSYNQIKMFDWKLQTWDDWQPFVVLAVYLGIAAVVIVSLRRRRNALFFLSAFFLVSLAPVANILMR